MLIWNYHVNLQCFDLGVDRKEDFGNTGYLKNAAKHELS
jgi:hypothetical protein